MRTFKPPKRKMPLFTGINPDGTLTILHGHDTPNTVERWKWVNDQWQCTEEHTKMHGVDYVRRPLWVSEQHGDGRYPVRIRANDNQFLLDLTTGVIDTSGKWAGNSAVEWSRRCALHFRANDHLLVMCESTDLEQTRINIYVGAMDWSYNPKTQSAPDVWVSFFGYFVNQFFGFHTNPNLMMCASSFEEIKPIAEIQVRDEKTGNLTRKGLHLNRGERLFCGIPLDNGRSYGLVGEKSKGTGKAIRFYDEFGNTHHDFMLPSRAHTLLLSPDGLTLTAIGFDNITQIDVD